MDSVTAAAFNLNFKFVKVVRDDTSQAASVLARLLLCSCFWAHFCHVCPGFRQRRRLWGAQATFKSVLSVWQGSPLKNVDGMLEEYPMAI